MVRYSRCRSEKVFRPIGTDESDIESQYMDCWSTDPTTATPIFPQAVSKNLFEAIWQAWYFSDNSNK